MIVLDANVVSETLKPQPDTAVLAWLDVQVAETLHLASRDASAFEACGLQAINPWAATPS